MDREQILGILKRHVVFADPIPNKDNIPAHCPFHKGGAETTPSFYVYVGVTKHNKKNGRETRPGDYLCHSCLEKGSFRTLLKKLNTPSDIIRMTLQELYGFKQEDVLELPKLSPFQLPPDFSNPTLHEHMLGFFEWCPKPLLAEGFTREILYEFDVGFDTRSARITFPIRNHHGELVGISGRTVIGSRLRYKIFKKEIGRPRYNLDKSKIVWNLNRFYKEAVSIGIKTPIVICEGFKAVIKLTQYKVPYAVCVLGTYISDQQIMLLTRCSDSVILFLDNDKAGIRATRSLIVKLQQHFRLTIANYPKGSTGKSPDELTKEEAESAIYTANNPSQWLTEHASMGQLRAVVHLRERYTTS